MSLPVFLRGLIVLLVAFAVATYAITGSAWSTLVDTAICAVLVQVGYFAVVLFLVWRTPTPPAQERGTAARDGARGIVVEEQSAKVGAIRGTNSSRNT